MYRRQPSDSLTVKDKITLLKAEIGDRVLTGNQLKIHRTFTKMTGRPTTIETINGNGDMIRFKIYSNKNDDGPYIYCKSTIKQISDMFRQ